MSSDEYKRWETLNAHPTYAWTYYQEHPDDMVWEWLKEYEPMLKNPTNMFTSKDSFNELFQ